MWKYAATLSYLGASYCGWQKQKEGVSGGKPSIQETVEAVLSKMTGEKVSVVASGRTDSGVHAIGQFIHFVIKEKEWKKEILQRGLNGLLPRDISVLQVRSVNLNFHAQRSAEKKQYSYYFQQGSCALPHLEPFSWWIRKELDLVSMSRGLNFLLGEHDFKPFQASGAKPGPTVRKILEAEVTLEPIPFPLGWRPEFQEISQRWGLIRIRIVGTGFLKQMVRGIAGTLLQIGEGRRPDSCIREILESKDRSLVGPTAPARALWLEKVWYPE
jgi:tRNA pseudouridine38-40 synthase